MCHGHIAQLCEVGPGETNHPGSCVGYVHEFGLVFNRYHDEEADGILYVYNFVEPKV